jgi:hypothetical protein
MSEARLYATVSDAGKLVPTAPTVWAASVSALAGKRVVVIIETERVARSTQANRYYWACVVPIFQEVWSRARSVAGLEPLTKDETHEVLVQVLLGCTDGPVPGTRLRVRTSELAAVAFARFIDDARALAMDQYRVVIPGPGERYEAEAT